MDLRLKYRGMVEHLEMSEKHLKKNRPRQVYPSNSKFFSFRLSDTDLNHECGVQAKNSHRISDERWLQTKENPQTTLKCVWGMMLLTKQ